MERPLLPTSADVVYHVLNRANAYRTLFEDTGTLPRVWTGAGAGVYTSLHATLGVLRHVQPLASCHLAAAGWRPVTMHELALADPYTTMASASPQRSGKDICIKAVSQRFRSNEQVSPDSLSRRDAESRAGGPRRMSGAVMLELGRDSRIGPVAGVAEGAFHWAAQLGARGRDAYAVSTVRKA